MHDGQMDSMLVSATFSLAWERFLAALRVSDLGMQRRASAKTMVFFEIDDVVGTERFVVEISMMCNDFGGGIKRLEQVCVSATADEVDIERVRDELAVAVDRIDTAIKKAKTP